MVSGYGGSGYGGDAGIGIDLNFEQSEGLIQNRGVNILHEIGIPCPCKTTASNEGALGHADPTCSRCKGFAFLWRDPVLLKKGLVSNVTFQRDLANAGWVLPGDMTYSPSLHSRVISDFDRITITNPFPVDPQVIVRGEKSVLTPRPKGLEDNEDFLFFQAAEAYAIWCEDDNEVVYQHPQFTLDGRKIIWTEGGGPAVGVKYSIKYRGHQEFVVFATPLQEYDRSRSLGQRVLLRRIALPAGNTRREITASWRERLDGNREGSPYGNTQGGWGVRSRPEPSR